MGWRTAIVAGSLLLVACSAPMNPSGTNPRPDGAEVFAMPEFKAALGAAGATVTDLGGFDPNPLSGTGTNLCVSGQKVMTYEFGTARERAEMAATIDPADPSKIGNSAIVEWAGNPTFWQRDRLIVLYLGSDPRILAGVSSVLGEPFAAGHGRDPGPAHHRC
jgi:hypothetical protein